MNTDALLPLRSAEFTHSLVNAERAIRTGLGMQQAPDGGQFWVGVAYSSTIDRWVAISDGNTGVDVMISSDGIIWEEVATPDGEWDAITWIDAFGLFVVSSRVASDAGIMTSPDGLTWTVRATATSQGIGQIAWSPTLGLALAPDVDGPVWTSRDGIAWTRDGTVTGFSPNVTGMAWGAGLFVGLYPPGGIHAIFTSPDGHAWTQRVNPQTDNQTYGAIAWCQNRGRFVVVAVTSDTGANAVMDSGNGIGWTERSTTPAELSGVAEVNGAITVVGVTQAEDASIVLVESGGAYVATRYPVPGTARETGDPLRWVGICGRGPTGDGRAIVVANNGDANAIMVNDIDVNTPWYLQAHA